MLTIKLFKENTCGRGRGPPCRLSSLPALTKCCGPLLYAVQVLPWAAHPQLSCARALSCTTLQAVRGQHRQHSDCAPLLLHRHHEDSAGWVVGGVGPGVGFGWAGVGRCVCVCWWVGWVGGWGARGLRWRMLALLALQSKLAHQQRASGWLAWHHVGRAISRPQPPGTALPQARAAALSGTLLGTSSPTSTSSAAPRKCRRVQRHADLAAAC